MNIKKNAILIIDGTNLMHRCYHVNPNAKTSGGIYTGAVFGTIMMLQNFVNKLKPIQIYFTFDASRNSFRNKLYPEYKGTRPPTPPELKVQYPIIEEFCYAANIPYLKMDEFEADDLMGSLATNCIEYGFNPYIVTGDKDLFQMISDDINVLYLSSKGWVIFDENKLKEKYTGLSPSQFLDLKALMGDKGDNIPGVAGIGEVTGIKLLNQYSSLDGIYANTHELKGKQKEKIENGKDLAYLSKELATIVRNVPLDYNYYFEMIVDDRCNFKTEKAIEFYKKYEMKSLLEETDTQQ